MTALAAEVEVYRSRRRAGCDERAFVLAALGIPSRVIAYDGRFLLQVSEEDESRATAELSEYEAENAKARPVAPPPPLHRNAWVGCAIYAAWLFGVAYMISNGLVRLDAFARGDLYGAGVQGGQWWRAWTALTLHLSGAHLAGNLIAGLWFGYLAGGQFGPGTAWLLIVVGGGLANLVEGLMAPLWYRSAGASTAVFTALGLMAAHTWRRGKDGEQGRLRRWGPLGAGIVLLAWLGFAGKHTDVLAHLLGFGFGVMLGWGVAQPWIDRHLPRMRQWPAGLAALGIMIAAWGCALWWP